MKKILIVRLSAIGDIVMASPVAAALKRRYPEAKILWLTQPECASLVQNNPLIDEVLLWPRAEWQNLWQQRKYRQLFAHIRTFRKQLKTHQIDLAIDLQGLLKSGMLTWLSGATRKVGLGSKEGSQWLMDQVIPRNSGDTDLIGSEYRWLCQQLQLDAKPWQMSIGASDDAINHAKQLIEQDIADDYIVICPFTTRPQKHWHDAGWQVLIPKLTKLGHTIVMLGGPADTEHAERIIDNEIAANKRFINLVGKTQLPVAALLIQQAKALIGVDTGLTHMGHAHDIPVLGLFGSTRPYLKTDTANGQIMYLNLHCSPCRRNPSCDGRFECLNDITPTQIVVRLNAVLAGEPIAVEVATYVKPIEGIL